jgi:endonuclease YncB( thermonuclease family)
MVIEMMLQLFRFMAWSVLALSVLTAAPVSAREISSYAFVNDNGSLRIKRKTIHLYGIHIPETSKNCRTYMTPVECGSRAALALKFKIQSFVRCEIIEENADGSLVGWCRVNASSFDEGEDLSAYLLERGWAVALPDAPVEYKTLEKIAYRRGFGIWGIQVDNIIRPD